MTSVFRINSPAARSGLVVSVKTGSYTLTSSDVDSWIVMDSSSDTTLTIPVDSGFKHGDVFYVRNIGSGVCSIVGGTGFIFNSVSLEKYGFGTITLNNPKSAVFSDSSVDNLSVVCDYAVVAGGGGGGGGGTSPNVGAGGGAGGYLSSFSSDTIAQYGYSSWSYIFDKVGTDGSTMVSGQVNVSADGLTHVASAYGEIEPLIDGGLRTLRSVVRSYVIDSNTQERYLMSDIDIEGEWFVSVALSGDGSILAVGSPFSDVAGTESGNVRIYEKVGYQWEPFRANIPGSAAGDYLGYEVCFSKDGNRLAVGGLGFVRVFDWSGSAWVQAGSDITVSSGSIQVGGQISLSYDGSRLALSDVHYDANGTDSGSVFVFEWSGSAWAQLGSRLDGDAAGDEFGSDVALSGDGSLVAAGARYNDFATTNAGSVKVFEWSGSAWVQKGSTLYGSSGFSTENFGKSVGLTYDGSMLIIGAPGWRDATAANRGTVYFYHWHDTDWIFEGDTIFFSDGAKAGIDLAISETGEYCAVASTHISSTQLNSRFWGFRKLIYSRDSQSSFIATKNVSYPIVVGSGGNGGANLVNGSRGSNSVLGPVLCIGGGGGCHGDANTFVFGSTSGGSGGGGPTNDQGLGIFPQGNDGWEHLSQRGNGGGAGSAATSSRAGLPIRSKAAGKYRYFAAGGSYGSNTSSRLDYVLVGGVGGTDSGNNAIAGKEYTGSGGGGGSYSRSGANGGSGIIIFRVPDDITVSFSSGVTYTSATSGGYKTFIVTSTSTNTETVVFS